MPRYPDEHHDAEVGEYVEDLNDPVCRCHHRLSYHKKDGQCTLCECKVYHSDD